MSPPIKPEVDDSLLSSSDFALIASAAGSDIPNTPAARNQNPGNLRGRNGEFRVFGSPEEGFRALVADVRTKQSGNSKHDVNGDSSLYDFFKVYAPEFENNTLLYTQTVAKNLGVTIDTPIKKLDTQELASAIAAFEDGPYWRAIQPRIQRLNTGTEQKPDTVSGADMALIQSAVGPQKTGADKFIEDINEDDRIRRGVTKEQQAEFLQSLDAPGQPRPQMQAADALRIGNLESFGGVMQQPLAPETEEEIMGGSRQLPGEDRADFLRRTADTRKRNQDLIKQYEESKNTISSREDKGWWENLKDNLGNMRLFSGGDVVSFNQTPGGIDVGQVFRLGNQIASPTIGEALSGHPVEGFKNFLNITGAFGHALADPLFRMPAALAWDKFSGEDYLLPEERSQYIRSAVANYAGLVAGYEMGKVLSASRTAILTAGRTALSEMSAEEMLALARNGAAVDALHAPLWKSPELLSNLSKVTSGFRTRLWRGVAEGGFGGAVTGTIEGHNPEESANLAVSYGLMAIPFGLAFEAVGSAKARILGRPTAASVSESASRTARDMLYLKMLRATQENGSDQAAAGMFSLATQQDLGNAMILTGTLSDQPMIVSDIEGGVGTKLTGLSDVNEFGAIHHRPDGKTDVLMMKDLESETTIPEVPQNPVINKMTESSEALAVGGSDFDTTIDRLESRITDANEEFLHAVRNSKSEAVQEELRDKLEKAKQDLYDYKATRIPRIVRSDESVQPALSSEPLPQTFPALRLVKDEVTPSVPSQASRNTRYSKTFFSQTGFLPDQTVSFLGQDYTYRGPIFEKGKLTGHTIADAAGVEYEVPWDMVQRGSDVLVSPVEFDKVRAGNAIYKDFKQTVSQLFDPDGKLHPDAIPDQPFDKLIASYLEKKQLPPLEAKSLRDFLETRFANDLLRQSLDPAERASYERLIRENARYKAEHPRDLADLATAAGFYIERPGGSSVVVRDANTGEIMWSGPLTNESLEKLIVGSGRAEGVSLDGNGAVPPSVGKGVMAAPPPANGPHTAPYSVPDDGVLRRFAHWFNTHTGRFVTGSRQYMIGLDAQLGTRFASEVWYKNQVAFTKKFGLMHPDLKIAQELQHFARGMSKEDLEHVTTLLETMAPSDMVKFGGLFRNRAFTDREISGANWFVENRIDIRKAFDYRRSLINLERFYGDLPEADLGEMTKGIQAAMNVDERHIEAARIIGRVIDINTPGELSIYGIVRLANAIMHGEVSPADYIKLNNLHERPKVTELADRIRAQLDNLADKFDIPEETRLNGYFAHLRNYGNDIPITNQNNIPIFVSDLLRTGERDVYDRDPINMLVRYTNSGYSARYTKEAWDNANDYLDNTLKALMRKGVIEPSDARVIRSVIKDNYLNELRGIPHDSSKFAQNFFNKFLDRLGVKTSVDVRRDLVNTALSLSSSATIGFRPMQGIRDLQNFISIFDSRFADPRRTGSMLTILSRYKPKDLVAMGIISEAFPGEGATSALHREGLIPTVGAIRVATPEEQALGRLNARSTTVRNAIQDIGEAGIKWGLQHNVYQLAHAASFLEGYTYTLKVLNDMVHSDLRGLEAKTAAYRKLKLDTYDKPVAEEFDRLVSAGKFEDAAKFMGHTNSFETVSVFGLANHPVGWGTNTGRLLGQFGSWPVWARSQLMRMMSRGTMKNRVASMAHFAMSQGALKATSWAMGLNLSSWYLLPGALGFHGGPFATAALNELNYIGGDERQQSVVHSLGDAVTGDFTNSDASFLARQLMLGIPGSYAARDIYEASQMAAHGNNPISAAARMFGVRSTDKPSLLNPYGASQP